ncbi:PadR family transcriptional regulator [Candidatus Woesearchaeota archaeon]|nr:PadR family transcriptional regulator [Candidatus Woesearchaeota archaeon]
MGNCCDMRGFLTFTVLRLVSKNSMSGEELRQELGRRKGSKPSPGTVYPVLKAMSANGWIREVGHGIREKKYRITAAGKKELKSATKKFISIFCDMKDEFDKVSARS